MIKKIGIVGGSGYTGGELIRILINHPNVEIDFVYSRTNDRKKIQDVQSLNVLHSIFYVCSSYTAAPNKAPFKAIEVWPLEALVSIRKPYRPYRRPTVDGKRKSP